MGGYLVAFHFVFKGSTKLDLLYFVFRGFIKFFFFYTENESRPFHMTVNDTVDELIVISVVVGNLLNEVCLTVTANIKLSVSIPWLIKT